MTVAPHIHAEIRDSGNPVGQTFRFYYGVRYAPGTPDELHVDHSGWNAVYAGDGPDLFELEATSDRGTQIFTGGGTDTVNLGTGSVYSQYRLANITNVLVDGMGGGDVVNLDDGGSSAGGTYTFGQGSDGSFVSWAPSRSMVYRNVGTLNLYTSGHADTIDVRRLEWGTTTRVYAGGGNDHITLGYYSLSLDWIHSPLTLDGQAGTDTVTINDSGDPDVNTYTLTHRGSDTRVQRRRRDLTDNPVDFTYARMETCVLNAGDQDSTIMVEAVWAGATSLTVNAGGGADTVTVRSTHASLTLTVDGGPGNDEIHLGSAANQLQEIHGPITVRGGSDADTLNLNDQGTTLSGLWATFTVRATTVARYGLATVTYETLEGLVLNAGSGNNPINVESTAAGTPVTVNAGGGDDTITLGNALNRLDDILGAVFVNGGGGTNTDTLTLNDQGTTLAGAQATYSVSESVVMRTGVAAVNYSGLNAVVLNAGSGGNPINVDGTTAGTPVTVNAGGGDDTITVGVASLLASVTVRGDQGARDTLVINDQPNTVGRSFTLTSAALSWGSAVQITWASLDALQLHTGNGSDTVTVSSAPAFAVTLHGNGGNNMLAGPNGGGTWALGQTVNSGTLNGTVGFTGMGRLLGGMGHDTFQIKDVPGVSDRIDGGPGAANTLDYSLRAAGVYANLVTQAATGAGGSTAGRALNIHNVIGGRGADLIVGSTVVNDLRGGRGRDVLIGGTGSDYLEGGDDDDLLIGGATTLDANLAALQNLHAEWTRTGLPGTAQEQYNARVQTIRTTILTPGVVLLSGEIDQLFGQGGIDWFWIDGNDPHDRGTGGVELFD